MIPRLRRLLWSMEDNASRIVGLFVIGTFWLGLFYLLFSGEFK